MTQTVQTYRWTASESLRAWEAGAFDHRVELIEGEVWPVVIGDWHSRTTARVIRALPGDHELMAGTLPPVSHSPIRTAGCCRAAQAGATGYLAHREYHRGTRIPVRCADTDLSVDDLLG